MKNIIFIIAALFLSTALCFGIPLEEEQKLLVQTAEKTEKENGLGDICLIREFNPDTGDLAPWRTMESASKDPYTMMQLNIYKKDNNIILVFLMETSPSGDWVKMSKYFFWPDGRIAIADCILNTFMGYVSVHRVFYYDKSGKQTNKEETIKDLNTDKIIPKEKASFMDNPPVLFLSLEELKKKLELPETVQ